MRVGDRLLRPVQDCSDGYGSRIHVEEILELTPETYGSRRMNSIEADWEQRLVGVHTYAFSRGFEVVDAANIRKRRAVAQ